MFAHGRGPEEKDSIDILLRQAVVAHERRPLERLVIRTWAEGQTETPVQEIIARIQKHCEQLKEGEIYCNQKGNIFEISFQERMHEEQLRAIYYSPRDCFIPISREEQIKQIQRTLIKLPEGSPLVIDALSDERAAAYAARLSQIPHAQDASKYQDLLTVLKDRIRDDAMQLRMLFYNSSIPATTIQMRDERFGDLNLPRYVVQINEANLDHTFLINMPFILSQPIQKEDETSIKACIQQALDAYSGTGDLDIPGLSMEQSALYSQRLRLSAKSKIADDRYRELIGNMYGHAEINALSIMTWLQERGVTVYLCRDGSDLRHGEQFEGHQLSYTRVTCPENCVFSLYSFFPREVKNENPTNPIYAEEKEEKQEEPQQMADNPLPPPDEITLETIQQIPSVQPVKDALLTESFQEFMRSADQIRSLLFPEDLNDCIEAAQGLSENPNPETLSVFQNKSEALSVKLEEKITTLTDADSKKKVLAFNAALSAFVLTALTVVVALTLTPYAPVGTGAVLLAVTFGYFYPQYKKQKERAAQCRLFQTAKEAGTRLKSEANKKIFSPIP